MKRGVFSIILLVMILNLALVSAEICNPYIALISQDPYPAIPGEYAKIVFQVSNISNPECATMSFELLEKYPLIFDPNTNAKVTIDSGFYQRDFGSFLIAPYKVRIDNSALKGDNPIETLIQYANKDMIISKQFRIYIEDSRAEFELHIDKYSYATQELVIEVLNIADTDIEALTLEIPKQDNIEIEGANRVVVGDLDSNEYTTADFKAIPKDGEILINILYTDQTGTRRELSKTLTFDSSYFNYTKVDGSSMTIIYIILLLVVVTGLFWWFFSRKKKRVDRMRKRGEARL
ncbi:MAG: hypothetical protein ABIH72_02790 [archaeon]